MNIVRKIFIFILSFLTIFLTPVLAFAQGGPVVVPPTAVPTNVIIGAPKGAIPSGAVDVAKIPQFILNLLFLIGIIVAIVFLIYGGIRWVFSRGDKAAVDTARGHIVAAIVGLIIVVAAFVIVNVVFSLLGVQNPLNAGSFQLPTLVNPGPTQAP